MTPEFEAILNAAEQGDAKAQHNLGNKYRHGEGVARDDTEAVKWYRKAAEQGYAEAQFYLGVAYRDGKGVPKNVLEAVKWYRKAAEQGLARAQHYLASEYNRIGDYVEAYAWLLIAAANGDRIVGRELAKRALPELEPALDHIELHCGEKRAAELLEQINANKAK